VTIPNGFKAADYGWLLDEGLNLNGREAFKQVTITWSKPAPWLKTENAPIGQREKSGGCLYIITKDHHRAHNTNRIVYVGITTNLDTRFNVHPKAHDILSRPGNTCLSIGELEFPNRSRLSADDSVLRQLEHILIWAANSDLTNEKNMMTPPGMGSSKGLPWHIKNTGYRFAGRLPLEIIYPWMLMRAGRNRSLKKALRD
jgi:hypothetical protein